MSDRVYVVTKVEFVDTFDFIETTPDVGGHPVKVFTDFDKAELYTEEANALAFKGLALADYAETYDDLDFNIDEDELVEKYNKLSGNDIEEWDQIEIPHDITLLKARQYAKLLDGITFYTFTEVEFEK